VTEHRSGSEIFGDPMGFGLMEYTYYQMATLAGIRMEPSEILLDGPRAHFLTRRFDRKGNDKIHMQTLCAMAHADYKKPGLWHRLMTLLTAIDRGLFGSNSTTSLSTAGVLSLHRRTCWRWPPGTTFPSH